MLKHVQISPLRNRSDTLSLRSSTSCSSSMCGSPEPPSEIQRTPSRASSYSSLNEQLPQTTIKVFTSCLKIDIEYKTLGIQWDTTSKEVIGQLLRRLKMRHRDPRLFYLSMEVSVRRAGVKTILVLDDDTRPAILQACHPKGESRFWLQLKPGGLIRVHTSALQPTSQYKALVISAETTSDELLQLLLSCYNSLEPVEQFSIYEVCPGQEYQRKLHPDDIPLRAQAERIKSGETCHFLVRRNPNYLRRRQLLSPMNDVVQTYQSSATVTATNHKQTFDANCSASSLDSSLFLDTSMDSLPEISSDDDDDDDSENDNRSSSTDTSSSSNDSLTSTATTATTPSSSSLSALNTFNQDVSCQKCQNNFKSCDFCDKNPSLIHGEQPYSQQQRQLQSYNPVYNIREIRTVSHSFSSLGSDKKLLDIQFGGRFDSATQRVRPQSVHFGRSTRIAIGTADAGIAPGNQKSNGNGKNCDMNGNALVTNVAGEAVKNDPAKGLGHFIYL